VNIPTAARHRIPSRVWNFIAYLTGGLERDFEDQRKRSVLAFFLSLAIIVAFPFAIHHFSIGNITRAVILISVGSVELMSLIALRYLKRANLIFRLNVLLLGLYFIFLVVIGGTQGSRLLWAFIFPSFAFYLLGIREGFLWSLLQGAIIATIFLVPDEILGSFTYNAEIQVRFLIIYALIMLMSYFVELTRKKYQADMEQAQLNLEDRVARRTEELQNVNKQLRTEIGERELAVQKHQAAEQEKAIILSSLMEFVLFEDKNMQILWANRAACESAGISHDEILGRYCYEIWAHEDDVCEDCPVQLAIQTGKPHEIEKMTPDGRAWMIRGYPVRDAENQIMGGIEVALEITDRKKAERQLKEAYEIINKSPAVAFLWKNERGWPVEFVTANIEFLLGYTPDDLLSGSVSYVDIVHPHDLDRVAEEVETFSRDSDCERFSHKPYRLISKDGEVKWVQDSTHIRRDQNGDITHYNGIIEDITDAVHMEEALRDSETMFRTLVENSQAGIFLVDEKYCFIYANQKLSQILGYDQKQIVGLDFREVLDTTSRDYVVDRYVRRQSGEDVPDRYEVGIVRKDGEARRLEMVATAIRNPDGAIQTMGQVLDITDRKQAEKSLRESEERFRELAINIREVFWLFDWEKQRVLYVSPAYEEIWGRSTSDLRGRYEDWGNSIHPDDAQQAEASFSKILETGGGEDREYRIIRPDGEIRWILDRGFAIKGENGEVKRIAGIAEDITERKQAEEQLRSTESNYRALFEAEPDGILIVDSESGIIVDANPSASKLYGYSNDELCGMQAIDLSAEPTKSKKHIAAISAETRDSPISPIAFRRHRKKDGTTFPVEILHGKYELENQTFICAIMRDITERVQVTEELEKHRKNLEALVQERTRELELAQEEILTNERLAVLGQLTATVSHELRNPLGVIRSSAFYLQQKNQKQDQKIIKHINRIEDQVEICDAIVSDLLEYTRGRHSQMLVGEINPWLIQVLEELPLTDGIQMDVALAVNLPNCRFDKEKMRRVVVNLMDNAFQAIAERKKLVTDEMFEPRIEVKTQAVDQNIMIRVKDTGIGMEATTVERAFEPLFTTRARGTGLGLANVKKIIEEHSGTVLLQSKPNEGTTVIITIPAAIQE